MTHTSRTIASNMNELSIGHLTILYSYQTPVAANIKGEGFYHTSKKWSQTTSRHITKWLKGAQSTEKPQEYFDSLTLQVNYPHTQGGTDHETFKVNTSQCD